MNPLVIIGAGGHGREILDIVEAMNASAPTYEFLGFLDDTGGDHEVLARRGMSVIGGVDDLRRIEARYLIGIGASDARRRIDRRATLWGREAAVAVHPAATLGSDLSIGPGCVIAAGARVTTDVRLGRHVHVNLNATVAHDCRIGDYVTVNPGANVNGNVELGDEVMIGSGAVLKEKVRVGRGTVVGAGAVVIRDLPDHVTAVGVPAAPLPRDVIATAASRGSSSTQAGLARGGGERR